MPSMFQVHITERSAVPDHCRPYALSFPGDKDYISPCDHAHKERCDRCDILPHVVDEIQSVLENIDDGAEKDEIKFQVEQSVQNISAWKAHILRSSNQDQARLDVLESLDPTSALLVLDWAMKFLPKKYRESQSDWFGKRGISWHITVAIRKKEDGTMQMLSFVHVFKKCSQVSDTVLAVIDDVFQQLKSTSPEVQTVFLRQDNAGCYHSTSILLSVQRIATKNNINLCQVDYSDPQGGKGSCDRKAATIKSHIRIYLNEGHDVETAEQMVSAIESAGGVPGVRVTLCGEQTVEMPFEAKWEGISFLNNLAFSREGVRVWRAYNIGPGKWLPWSKLDIPTHYQLPTLNKATPTHCSDVSFTDVTVRRRASAKSKSPTDQITDTPDETDSDSDEQSLFFCTEEGCIKSYQRLSSLQNHLDCGKHQYVLERETLYDKAMLKYAARLEEGASTNVPYVSDKAGNLERGEPSLKMGWALKSSKHYKRLSKKQKDYLLDIYNAGDQTGHKADPVSVSKSMRKARLPSGEPIFKVDEYLTSQQIASFFSRETAKKKGAQETEAEKDQQAVERETLLQGLQKDVMDSISIGHPIMHGNYNLCDYASNKKLDKLSILLLQDICSSLQLDISNIKVKRKKPYIMLIESLVENCSCKS